MTITQNVTVPKPVFLPLPKAAKSSSNTLSNHKNAHMQMQAKHKLTLFKNPSKEKPIAGWETDEW